MPELDEAHGRRRRVRQLVRVVGMLAVAGFVVLLAYGLIAKSPNRTIDDRLAKAESAPAPGFDLEVLQRGRVPATLGKVVSGAAADGRLSLRELRGTPVVLNFWASWCDPCRVEAPTLERGWRSAARAGVVFLGLDMQDVREDAKAFLRRFAVTYPVVREPGKDTSRRYGATGIPETYFISARGRVVGHVIGAISARQLRDGVVAAQSGTPRRAGQGGARQDTR